jgi:CDP-glucose 4,6-dehydratase
MFNNIYKNKTILITGHTGFKGSWLVSWLKKLKTKRIIGIALPPHTSPSHYKEAKISSGIKNYNLDLKKKDELKKIIIKESPDFIFHLAANPLVKESYTNPIQTWETNLMGTVHVLESSRYLKKKCALIMITSDKSYQNNEWIWGYRENDRLGGDDPYSASKSACELAINSYVRSFYQDSKSLIRISAARAGNVIGGGDWSNDRIVPDCIKAWSKNKLCKIRNPFSTRPWQHVIEPIVGYLIIGQKLYENSKFHGEAFNFGPGISEDRNVISLVKEISKNWKGSKWLDVSKKTKGPKEAKLLKLNCDKSNQLLGWRSILNFENTAQLTVNWYQNFYNDKKNIFYTTNDQIEYYCKLAKINKLEWIN